MTKKARTSKLDRLGEGVTGLADAAGVDATLGGFVTGKTVDGKMSYKELSALPPGTPAPPKDEWIVRLSSSLGTLHVKGCAVSIERLDGELESLDTADLRHLQLHVISRLGFPVPSAVMDRLAKGPSA